eukprot:6847930-Pyramimonas_sp.AAC.1
MFADYFTVAVRTGGAGKDGLSMLLIEKGMPGVECTQMQCTGVWASGTAFVTFTDVKVSGPPTLDHSSDGSNYNLFGLPTREFSQILSSPPATHTTTPT